MLQVAIFGACQGLQDFVSVRNNRRDRKQIKQDLAAKEMERKANEWIDTTKNVQQILEEKTEREAAPESFLDGLPNDRFFWPCTTSKTKTFCCVVL